MVEQLLSSVLALASAAFYGAGDFAGGRASSRHHAWQVLALMSMTGVLLMAALGVLWREPLPSVKSALAGGAAGLVGAVGLTMLYRGLATGRAAIVSPTAAVVGAIVPVAFGAIVLGLPSDLQKAGFIAALAGIWLVTRSGSDDVPAARNGFLLGVGSGVAFGLFFVLIAQVDEGSVFFPLMIAKIAASALVLIVLRRMGLSFPRPLASPLALLAAVLDSGANACYLLAAQVGRADVAAVLTSLYPAGTVVLSAVLIKERVAPAQWAGVLLCLLAIALIVA